MPGTYKIGEAAALLNLKTYVLRFWETEFPQIAPLRTETGRRVYTDAHLALLERIRFLLHERGLTIDGARRILAEEAAKGMRYAPPVSLKQGAPEPVASVDPGLFDAPSLPLTSDERRFLEEDSADLYAKAVEPAPDAPDTAFLREIRDELEQVAAILAGPGPQGDDRA